MIIIGLTGGIATGKSTTANMFRERGIAVFDADQSVHYLLGVTGKAVPDVCAAFGKDVLGEDGAIDRNRLGQRVFQNLADLRKLENILHPLVACKREEFLARQRQKNAQVVVLDVPLLFETRMHDLCDLIVVTNVAADIQRERALSRDGMTSKKFTSIVNSQIQLTKKLAQADFILDTGTDLNLSRQRLFHWLDMVLG